MEAAVKTLKEEVIEYLTQSENAQLFEAVKQEITCFEENGRSTRELLTRLWESEIQIALGEVISQEEVEAHVQAWKGRHIKFTAPTIGKHTSL